MFVAGLSGRVGGSTTEEVPGAGSLLAAREHALPLLGLRAAVRTVLQVPELRPRPAAPRAAARRARAAPPPGRAAGTSRAGRAAGTSRAAGARGAAAVLRASAAQVSAQCCPHAPHPTDFLQLLRAHETRPHLDRSIWNPFRAVRATRPLADGRVP